MLAALFVVIFTSQATFTIDVVRELAGDYAAAPIVLGGPWPTITQVYYGDSVRAGDRVVSIEGRTQTGTNDLPQIIREKKPGEKLNLIVVRAGQTLPCSVVLGALSSPWLFLLVWRLFMPWLCIALGFWVVAARPRDVRSWAVLSILVGICQIYHPNQSGWPAPIALASIVYVKLAPRTWPIGMMLFGIYFPNRWRLDRRVPWAKWVLLVPLVAFGLWDALRGAIEAVNVPTSLHLPNLDTPLEPVIMALCISLFFFAMGSRSHDEKSPLAPDEKRRLNLLHGGGQAALTPFSVVFFYSLIVHHRLPQEGPLLAVALMAMVLLPITMAYVIIVERALDVRVVVRQGMQYALARSGIRAIQFALALAIIYLSVRFFEAHNISQLFRYCIIGVEILLVARLRDIGDILRRWLDRRFFREAYDAERVLSELSEQVRAILDTSELLHTVARKIAESLHVERIAVLLPSGGAFHPAFATGYDAPLDMTLSASGPTVTRLRAAHGPISVDADEGPELAGLDAQLLLPLPSKENLLGFISLGPKRSEEPYSSSDTRLLTMVAAQTGLALENSRLSEAIAHEVSQRELLHREIEIAREVQQRLFPQNLPKVPSLDYAGHCRPALGVGGDYYDFLSLPGGQLGLAIADISGKGIPAALLMASLQASVRGQSQGPGDVSGLLTNVNRLVYEASPASRYATFFYARFDPQTRRLTWSNGGHNPPILLRGSEVIRLETGGSVVGLFPACAYEQDSIVLEAGDLLILYTDGMSEAENPAEEEWGEDALIEAARACATLPPAEMIPRIMEAADAFANGAPQHDDMTLVIARVTA